MKRSSLEVRLMEVRDHVGRGITWCMDKRTKQFKVLRAMRSRIHNLVLDIRCENRRTL